jgi:F0F1-type ATP synthase membrane subunit b/b'
MAELNLFPDERVLIQATVYVAALACAHYYLIKPALRLHRERLKRTSGTVAALAQDEHKMNNLEAEYNARLREAAEDARELRNKGVLAGQAEAEEILRLATTAARDRLESVRSSVESQVVIERTRLDTLSKEVGSNIVKKIGQGLASFLVFPLVGCLFGGASVARAAGGGHVDFWSGIFWPYFNFLVYAAGLWLFGRKLADAFLQKKRDGLRTQLSEARQATHMAEKRVREYQERVHSLESDLSKMREEYVSEGLRQRDELIAEARRLREQIISDAERRAQEIVLSSREALKAELVTKAMAYVEEQFQGEFLEATDQRLHAQALSSLKQMN